MLPGSWFLFFVCLDLDEALGREFVRDGQLTLVFFFPLAGEALIVDDTQPRQDFRLEILQPLQNHLWKRSY